MRYYIPEIVKQPDSTPARKPSFFQRLFGADEAPPAPAEDGPPPVGQFGGMPATFPKDRWPHCTFCNGAMSFIAQFDHDLPALDLGAAGRSLYIFMCDHDPGMCFTWEADRGANACIVLEPSEKYSGPAYVIDAPSWRGPAPIHRWLKRDDALTEGEAEMLAKRKFPRDMTSDERDALFAKPQLITHIGGIPNWIQGAHEGDKPGWQFVGQLESGLTFLQDADCRDIDDPEHQDKPSPYESNWFNFGGGGAAYLFAERSDSGAPPVFHMFWQTG